MGKTIDGSAPNVNYIEPNYGQMDDFNNEFAPDLSDYSIAVNIEAEIFGRSVRAKSDKGSTSNRVMILTIRGKEGAFKVGMLEGTKIYAHAPRNGQDKANNPSVNYLTTNYTDVYLTDVHEYQNSEMFGIKSIDVSYEKFQIPQVTVKFTDVRGMALFQPTELRNTNNIESIKGFSRDNLASSFFQCFFSMPYPQFTFYIKGFYGEPVSYQMNCSDFRTTFNPESGDFDITVKFIGYMFSFLGDVSFNALLAAPYSPYLGKQYWDDMVSQGRFYIMRDKTNERMPMPTLMEIYSSFKDAEESANGFRKTNCTSAEDESHEEEIAQVDSLLMMYKDWYNSLGNLASGHSRVYIRQEGSDVINALIIFRKDNGAKTLNKELNPTKEFITQGQNLNNLVAEIGEETHKVSETLEGYTPSKVIEFKKEGENITPVVDAQFKYASFMNNYLNKLNDEGGKSRQSKIQALANGGGFVYVVEVDYSYLVTRKNNLLGTVTEQPIDQIEAARLIADKLSWYPSIENFTRIVIAHFETLMHMMYTVANEITYNEKRTVKSVGVKIEECADLNAFGKDDTPLPPFPRLVKEKRGKDGVTTVGDEWIGNFPGGQNGWREMDFVEGLLQGANSVISIVREHQQNDAGAPSSSDEGNQTGIIPYPTTPYDAFSTSNPYGGDDTVSDLLSFCGKVASRAFAVFSLAWKNIKDINQLTAFQEDVAANEAKNFIAAHPMIPRILSNMVTSGEDGSTLNGKTILNIIHNDTSDETYASLLNANADVPWSDDKGVRKLFGSNNWMTRYYTKTEKIPNSNKVKVTELVYPSAAFSFQGMKNIQKSVTNNGWCDDSTVMMTRLSENCTYEEFLSSANAIDSYKFIIEEQYTKVRDYITNAMQLDGSYNELFNYFKYATLGDESKIGINSLTEYKEFFDLDSSYQSFHSKFSTYSGGLQAYDTYFKSVSDSSVDATQGYIVNKIYQPRQEKYPTGEYKYATFDKNKLFINPCNTEVVMNEFVLSIKCFNYLKIINALDKQTFTFLPRLAILQLGAIADGVLRQDANNPKWDYASVIQKVPLNIFETNPTQYVSNNTPNDNTIAILRYLKRKYDEDRSVVYHLAKYFKTWYDINMNGIIALMKDEKNKTKIESKEILVENSKGVDDLTRDLMSPLLVVQAYDARMRAGRKISNTVFERYFNMFLSNLKEGYKEADKEGYSLQMVEQDMDISTDVKQALYNYLKALYDKWVPASTMDDWKLEKFFTRNYESEGGHSFFFIDSFYADIGQLLPLNVGRIAVRIEQVFGQNNYEANLLSFLNDVYSDAKCMLLSVQSFIDMTDSGKMNKMFTLVPFESARMPKKFPDFVVLYAYEADKAPVLTDGEFKSSSFMLNKASTTPKAILSRASLKNGFNIPAFGVSYGRQYQSYFKEVNVDMDNPIVTEQAIKAKYAIIDPRNREGNKSIVTYGQDLFDVYSNTSYTCRVEMMGCAWVQPLMYFVLLNIPMFCGSYIVQKVTHQITPGNMKTSIVGVRMANVSSTIVSTLATLYGSNDTNEDYVEIEQGRVADVDNDCPYMVYAVEKGEGQDLSGLLSQKVGSLTRSTKYDKYEYWKKQTMEKALSAVIGQEDATTDLNIALQALVLYNRWRKNKDENIFSKEYVAWKSIGPSTQIRPKVIQTLRSVWSNPMNVLNYNNGVAVPNPQKRVTRAKKGGLASAVTLNYDILSRLWFAENYTSYEVEKNRTGYTFGCQENNTTYSEGDEGSYWELVETSKTDDVRKGFFEAVQNSARSSDAANCTLKFEVKGNSILVLKEEGHDKSDNNGHLGKVFDIILNTKEYFDAYVVSLKWVVDSLDSDIYLNNPKYIEVEVKKNRNGIQRISVETVNGAQLPSCVNGMSTNLKWALLKHYGPSILTDNVAKTEVGFLANGCDNVFTDMELTKCEELFATSNPSHNSEASSKEFNIKRATDYLLGKLAKEGKFGRFPETSAGDKDIKPYQYYNGNYNGGHEKCARAVARAIRVGLGHKDWNLPMTQDSGDAYTMALPDPGEDKRRTLMYHGFEKIAAGRTGSDGIAHYKEVHLGDVVVFDTGGKHPHGHVCMYCTDRLWRSDFGTNTCRIVDKDANRRFTVWRHPHVVTT